MRKIEIDADKYGRLLEKYFKEDLTHLTGIDVTGGTPVTEAQAMLADATDAVLADDILDGAARWYAYKQTMKIQQALRGGKR